MACDHAAELAADVRGDLEQARVRRDGLQREALDDGEAALGDGDREREGAAEADLRTGLGAREVRVVRDVDDPGGAAAGGTRPGRPTPEGIGVSSVIVAEGVEARSGGRGARRSRAGAGRRSVAGHVDVADGPAGPVADVLDAGEHAPRRWSRACAVAAETRLDQLDERRVGRERHRVLRRRRRLAAGRGGTVAAVAPAPTRAAIWARRFGLFEDPDIMLSSSERSANLFSERQRSCGAKARSRGTPAAARRGPGAARAPTWRRPRAAPSPGSARHSRRTVRTARRWASIRAGSSAPARRRDRR